MHGTPHIVGMQKALVIAAMALGVAACGDLEIPSPGGPDNNNNGVNGGQPTCDGLDGDTFASVDDQPLGERCEFDANQNYQCTELYGVWTITFDLGEFYWDTYQFVGSGTYTCSKGKIVGNMNGQTFEGTYGGGSLTWDGLRYRR